jgi:hypothetical protein
MFVALGIQHAIPMHRIAIYGLTKGTIFNNKKKVLNTKCVFGFPLQLWSEIFLILRRI